MDLNLRVYEVSASGAHGQTPHLAINQPVGELLGVLFVEPDPALARPQLPHVGHEDVVPHGEDPDSCCVHVGGAADVVTGGATPDHGVATRTLLNVATSLLRLGIS